MADLNDIPLNELRSAWRTLATFGTPPASEIAARVLPAWSVGLDGWLDRLVNSQLRDYARENTHFKLVVAPYGGGKTHFLLALGARAVTENWAVCYLQCKAHVTVGDWFGLYEQIAKAIQLPGVERTGVRPIVQRALDRMRERAEKAAGAFPDAALDEMIAALREDNWPHSSFGRVIATAMDYLRDPDANPEEGEAAMDWLNGNIAKETFQVLRRLRLQPLTAAGRQRHGQELFYSMAKFVPKAGVHGLVLLLDEMEVTFNARGKALEKILVSMRTMLDAPDGRMERIPLFGVFAAVPDVWSEVISKRYEALKQRFQVFDPFHRGNDDAAQIDLAELGKQRDILRAIGEKLLELGIRVHGWNLDAEQQRRNLEKLASVTADQLLEVNARRLFVKAWCSLLGEQGRNGGQDYTEEFLTSRIRGVNEEFRQADQAQTSNDIG
jgi:hypothetical protein